MRGFSTHLPTVELFPGELVVLDRPSVVVTVLGSCVAVTLCHRGSGLASICHALLPENSVRDSETEPFRYVEPSVRHMAAEFRRRIIDPRETEVKVFGGGEVLVVHTRPGDRSVGARNIQAALDALRAEGYEVAASDVGGPRGRKIFFDTSTGVVHLKRLSKAVQSGEKTGTRGDGP